MGLNTMWSWHDDWLLWMIQEGLYAHPFLTSLGLLTLIAVVPEHRIRLWWIVMSPVNLLCLLCLTVYGAWTAAPGLSWAMLGVLLYQTVRWFRWRARAQSTNVKTMRWLSVGALPMKMLAAIYVQIDPRAVYWLDLARAERGFAIHRLPSDRHASVRLTTIRSFWWRCFWHFWFWLTEQRIRFYSFLCRPPVVSSSTLWSECHSMVARFYRVPQVSLALAEPHLQSELESAVDEVAKQTLATWAGKSFSEYRSRTKHDQALAMQKAAAFGRQWMLHREALTELQTLREPWLAGESGLETAARFVYSTWQVRRQFDFLWHPESDSLDFKVAEFPEPSSLMENDDAVQKREVEGVASTVERLGAREESPFGEREFAANFEPADGISINADMNTEFAMVKRTMARHTIGDDGEAGSGWAEGGVATSTTSDHELFASTKEPDESDEPESNAKSVSQTEHSFSECLPRSERPPRECELLRDLRQGIQLLRAFVGLPDSSATDEQSRLEAIFRKQAEQRAAVLLLVALQTMAEKYTGVVPSGSNHSSQRDPIARWPVLVRETAIKARNRASARASGGQPLAEELIEREFFGNFYLDVQYERQAFLGIREYLAPMAKLSPYQYKLLGDAEVQLSIRLAGQPQLQSMLRLDAIGHYFQASYSGLWTFEVAGALLGNVNSREEMLVAFAANPLDISGGGALGVQESNTIGSEKRLPMAEGDIAHVLGAQRSLRIEVNVRDTKYSQAVSIATPFHIGAAAHCNWKLSPSLPPFSLICREGQLWLETPNPSNLLSVNGKNPIHSTQLNPGDVIQVGQIAIQIQSVSVS